MRHKITVASNPRILVVFFIAVALPVGGILLTVLFNIFLGIVVTIVAGFIAYHLIKFGISNLKSWIETDEDGIIIQIAYEETRRISWESITHAGTVFQRKMKDQVFVYAEKDDKLFTIPNEYSGFDILAKLIAEKSVNADFEEVHLEQTETISDYLKTLVEPLQSDDAEESESPESQDQTDKATDPSPET